MSEDPWASYEAAVVRLHLPDGLVVVGPDQPDRTSGTFPPAASGGAIVVITAHNPGGTEVTTTENARAHRQLLERLDREGTEYHPAAGGDQNWAHVEESVAILGMDVEVACGIGRDFGQDAIFVWTDNGLTVTSCTTDATTRAGWQILDAPETARRVDEAYRRFGLDSPYVQVARAYAAAQRVIDDTKDPDEAERLEQLSLAFTQEYWRLADARAGREAARRRRTRLPPLEDEEAARARYALAPILEAAASGGFDPDLWVPEAGRALADSIAPRTRALETEGIPRHLLDLWSHLCHAVEQGDAAGARDVAERLGESALFYAAVASRHPEP
ncbi:hypothetical protein GCM10022399_42390 [Terrabacter ginsenosidimutans]|uniref:DUF3293 domain-containing protein n=1 Tax=Terrabacter ginsenosidimutans TaxID=490575 RepID=A0ABP7EP32_9MICO